MKCRDQRTLGRPLRGVRGSNNDETMRNTPEVQADGSVLARMLGMVRGGCDALPIRLALTIMTVAPIGCGGLNNLRPGNIPPDPEVACSAGHQLVEKGEYDAAIVKFQEAVRLDPKLASGYHGWGEALRSKGDPEGAIGKYRMAIGVEPKFAGPYAGWGGSTAG